ncbi:hypothetical protein [Pectobacterium phage PcCB7V]|nr:hypothetical protein [Pectobacterium phage PcCB7V]
MGNIKWWALMPAANEDKGGDGKRPPAQQYFWWPSNIQPGA